MKGIEELPLFFKEFKNSWWKFDKFQVKIRRKLKEEGSGRIERRGKKNKKERKENDEKRKEESKMKKTHSGETKEKEWVWKIFWPIGHVFQVFFFVNINI